MADGTVDTESVYDKLTKITLDFFWKRHCPWCIEYKENCKCKKEGRPCLTERSMTK